ncbi:hypothetical protein CPLU01_05739, partial [Colletotrichum plurivorum]
HLRSRTLARGSHHNRPHLRRRRPRPTHLRLQGRHDPKAVGTMGVPLALPDPDRHLGRALDLRLDGVAEGEDAGQDRCTRGHVRPGDWAPATGIPHILRCL